uniref:Interferon regulatory factor 5 n=1 Tax=Scleropages formosus TaxID=113540 RepID=A0A8C9UY39_SCLFO
MSLQPRRIRLKPWLLAQVNSGRFPGLQWVNPDHTCFQIPWHHATRHHPLEEENTIFKAWALETGKYQEGVDSPDPAKWKANLRCALNKSREFKIRFDGTKETPIQPYKIYEICDQPHNGEMLLVLLPFSKNMFHMQSLIADNQPVDLSNYSAFHMDYADHSLPVDSLANTGYMYDSSRADKTEGNTGGTLEHEQPAGEVDRQPCIYDLLSNPHMLPLTDLDIRFLYRGQTAGSLTVSNPQGCRLYSSHLEAMPDQVDLFGPVGLQQVLFPSAAEIPNDKQRLYTESLLGWMDRGLILEIQNQDIYAVRLCQCRVFWSGPNFPEQSPPNPMERERRVEVFNLNNFLQGLILYLRQEAPALPPFEIYFCFGEDWPDQKPKEKKLIFVQVIPVVARILMEMVSGEFSWSLDSIRLQISNPDLKDQTVEQFKEVQRLLQSH